MLEDAGSWKKPSIVGICLPGVSTTKSEVNLAKFAKASLQLQYFFEPTVSNSVKVHLTI